MPLKTEILEKVLKPRGFSSDHPHLDLISPHLMVKNAENQECRNPREKHQIELFRLYKQSVALLLLFYLSQHIFGFMSFKESLSSTHL